MKSYKYLLFDLDGTLTKSEYGIIDSVIYALGKMNIEIKDRESLKKFIGPPLYESYRKFCNMNQEDAETAVKYYREIYEKEGVFNAPLYDGIEKLLYRLKEEGYILMVVTSKPYDLAEVVIEHNKIQSCFAGVVGPDRAEKHSDKSGLIRRAVKILQEEYSPGEDEEKILEQTLMIGDTHFDIEAAVKAGTDSVGVLYGYGTEEELRTSGATYIAETPEDIYGLIH